MGLGWDDGLCHVGGILQSTTNRFLEYIPFGLSLFVSQFSAFFAFFNRVCALYSHIETTHFAERIGDPSFFPVGLNPFFCSSGSFFSPVTVIGITTDKTSYKSLSA